MEEGRPRLYKLSQGGDSGQSGRYTRTPLRLVCTYRKTSANNGSPFHRAFEQYTYKELDPFEAYCSVVVAP